ncbi:MAG: hypothetical protein PHV18_14775 [Lachnospiraceae bacterium]|nr:hypothetical protein [Lachnospiraceae bacterium]
MRKDSKERRAARKQIEMIMEAAVAKDPPVKTWSATHPAYYGTVLCPDRRYRK